MLTKRTVCHILVKENKAGTNVPSPAATQTGQHRSILLSKSGLGALCFDDSDGLCGPIFYFPQKDLTICFVI